MGKKNWKEKTLSHLRELEGRTKALYWIDYTEKQHLLDENQVLTEIVRHFKGDTKMLDWCRQEINKLTQNIRKKELNKGIIQSTREIGFHAGIKHEPAHGPLFASGPVNSASSTDTPKLKDVKKNGLLVCLQEGKNDEFELIFNKKTYEKMMMYTRLLDVEIIGLLEVEVKKNKFYLEDIHLFRQIVSGGQCEPEDETAIIELMDKMIKEGKNPGKLKCWWHSHNTMGTSPSGTDKNTAEKFANNSFLITLITNHKGDIYTKLTVYKPFEFEIEDIPVYVNYEEVDEELIKECSDGINSLVKQRSWTSSRRDWRLPAHDAYGDGYDFAEYGYGYNHEGGYGYLIPSSPAVVEVPKTKEENKALLGKSYKEGTLTYIFNEKDNKYEVFDEAGKMLSEEEAKAIGARDLNKENK